jgi:hypothetical protein
MALFVDNSVESLNKEKPGGPLPRITDSDLVERNHGTCAAKQNAPRSTKPAFELFVVGEGSNKKAQKCLYCDAFY